MKRFATLYRGLDQTTKINDKINALATYFNIAPDKDKLWTIALFSHKRPKRTINTSLLRMWAAERAGLPQWLFDESYHIVGDLAETIALVLPANNESSPLSLDGWIKKMISMRDQSEEVKKSFVFEAWNSLDRDERFLFNKLITGGFRIGVSQKLVVRGLSQATGIEENVLAHRLMGNWNPLDHTFKELIFEDNPSDNLSKPYPFYLAYALEGDPHTLGDVSDWYAERKWDGIRGQLIVREGNVFVWSRGEELVTDKFPEFLKLQETTTDNFVLDGEIICFKDGQILPFNVLQTRIGRKNVSKKHLIESPVIMIAYDLLEYNGDEPESG